MAIIEPTLIGIISGLIVWNSIVSFLLYKTMRHYNSLVKTTDRKTLQSALDALLSHVGINQEAITSLQNRLQLLQEQTDHTLQKISLLRFNPFTDTGGEQSFIIALLDNKNNGILITSLQGRNGVRWFAKKVLNGKGHEFELSKEEKQSVTHATKVHEQ